MLGGAGEAIEAPYQNGVEAALAGVVYEVKTQKRLEVRFMNVPRFTADAALYKTSGQYQTNRTLISLRTQMVSLIYPAAGEVIEVHGCRPGQFQLGEGDDMVCIDPTDGHDVGDLPGDGPGHGPDAGPTSGDKGIHKPPPRPPRPPHLNFSKYTDADRNSCSPEQLNTPAVKKCVAALNDDILNNSPDAHGTLCDSKGRIWCCQYDTHTTNIHLCERSGWV